VEAIEKCGGQMTADGKRMRTGGGILWNILKTREPKAYKEIMLKGKEFEVSTLFRSHSLSACNSYMCDSRVLPFVMMNLNTLYDDYILAKTKLNEINKRAQVHNF
jgi:PHAX RNA-binding domain